MEMAVGECINRVINKGADARVRIVLIGQGTFAAAVVEGLIKNGEEVVGVYTPSDRRGEALREVGTRLAIRVVSSARMGNPQVLDDYLNLEADLGVMAYVSDIVPLTMLNHPKLGMIEYHPSLLPRHRGGSAINWAIIQGETKTGLTIFWPDGGIDTGPILLQKEVEISSDDTAGSLYYSKLFPMGVAALVEAVELVKQGVAPRIPQDESQASYEGLCNEGAAVIDFNLPAPTVYNLIRGTNPRPGATTSFRAHQLKIFTCELCSRPVGELAGRVVEIDKGGFIVATGRGAIRVKQIQYDCKAKMASTEFIQLEGLRQGDQLG